MKEASGNGVFCCPECGATVHLVGYSPVEPDSRSTQPGWPPMSNAGIDPFPHAQPPAGSAQLQPNAGIDPLPHAPPPAGSAQLRPNAGIDPFPHAQPPAGSAQLQPNAGIDPLPHAPPPALAASHAEMAVVPSLAPNWSSDDADEPTRVHRSAELDSAVSSFGEESTVIIDDIDSLLESPASARKALASTASAPDPQVQSAAMVEQALSVSPLEHRGSDRKPSDSKDALVWRLPPPPPPPAPDHRAAARSSGHFPAHGAEHPGLNPAPLPSFAESASLNAGPSMQTEAVYAQHSPQQRSAATESPMTRNSCPEETANPGSSVAQDFAPTPAYPAALEYAAVPAYPAASAYPAALDYAAVPAPVPPHQFAPTAAASPIIDVSPLPPPVQVPAKYSVVGPETESAQAVAPLPLLPILPVASMSSAYESPPVAPPIDLELPPRRVEAELPPPISPAVFHSEQVFQPAVAVPGSPTATPAFAAESASRPVTRALSDAPTVRDAQHEPRRGMARAQFGFALGAAVVGVFFLAQNAMRSGDRSVGVAPNRELPVSAPVAPAAAVAESRGDKATSAAAADAPAGNAASPTNVAPTQEARPKSIGKAVQSIAPVRNPQQSATERQPSSPASPAPPVAQASGKKKAAAEPADDSGPGPFDTDAAESAVEAAATRASACRQADDPSGVAVVTITFAPSGRVTTATLAGPPFTGTATGSCIAAKMRTANIPAFSGKFVTVKKTVTIR